MKVKTVWIGMCLFAWSGGLQATSGGPVSLKDESYKTMTVLVDALMKLRITDPADSNFGALQCPACNVLHTRAAEAVYPLSVAFKRTGDVKYLRAAVALGNWLIRQQLPDGSWKETPEEWTGTTTDQLLMMVHAYRNVKQKLSKADAERWEHSMRMAADFLVDVMNPEFASINYCTTTTATLATMNRYFPNDAYLTKARTLAAQILAKMDDDGFIQGEGERAYDIKYGADIGYEIDISLWGLALYAGLTGDRAMEKAVRASLKNHLIFVYPNGAIDGSWGIRSNKWCTFGSETADGCQILFSLFAKEDPRYRTAAMRNLEYLRTMMKNGIIGYGPHYFDMFQDPPCIYPTFVRSKNLALAVELGEQEPGETPPLPTEKTGWAKLFPGVDVAVVRTENFLATVTSYRYKDIQKTYKSKYMHRPTGGAISCLWLKDHGFLQISSQTEYNRWEPMHFPVVEGIRCLTPRIEFADSNGYFTNLYNFDGSLRLEEPPDGFRISASGELCDKKLLPGGVAYSLVYDFKDRAVQKTVQLRYHGKKPDIDIVEPIVKLEGMKFIRLDDRRVSIQGRQREFLFEIVEGNVGLETPDGNIPYRNVFPSVDCYPIVLHVSSPGGAIREKIVYTLSVLR